MTLDVEVSHAIGLNSRRRNCLGVRGELPDHDDSYAIAVRRASRSSRASRRFGLMAVAGSIRCRSSESARRRRRGPPRRWSVFSSQGCWLGDLEAPDGVNIIDSRADIVLGIWQDELDVPYVQLHRLTEE